jgi:urea transport system permease protein
MSLFLSQLINGLSNSAILFLVAIGLVVIFGMLDVVNMAHGEFIMLGAYCSCVCVNSFHLPFFFAAALAFIITGAIGMVIEQLLIRRLYGKVSETLLVTFALTYIIQQIIRMIFGPEAQSLEVPIAGSAHFGSITVPYYNLLLVGAALAVLLLTLLLFYKTTYGMQLRAITQNRSITQCLGIDSERIDMITFAYGSALAGFAGALIAPVKNVFPGMGTAYVVDSFMVVILGGLNSIIGSFFGSFCINESTTIMSGYMSQVTAKLLIFILIIILVRFKPHGLFSTKDKR